MNRIPLNMHMDYLEKLSIAFTYLLLVILSTTAVLAQSESTQPATAHTSIKRDISITQITSGLDHPWSIAFISATDWLVTERSGALRRVLNAKLQAEPIKGLPRLHAKGQGGLLDVVLHPDFNSNQWVYLSYTSKRGFKYGTEVARGKLVDNELRNVEIIFTALPKLLGGVHFGSRLTFDDKGYLYISLGDRGAKELAQQLDSHVGTIIRLHDDGAIPEDNPFVNVAGALPEIYSYGHRNVQGMVFDKKTKTLWAHEHGPQGGDELNQVLSGKNYGWPTITYGVNYGFGTKIGEGTEKPGMSQPVTFWDPSIAPSGLAFVDSSRYPEWQDNLLVGALKYQLIARLEVKNNAVLNEERLFANEYGRIRDIRQGPDGFLYFITDSGNGSIYRID